MVESTVKIVINSYLEMIKTLKKNGYNFITCVGTNTYWLEFVNQKYIKKSKQVFLLGGDYEYDLDFIDNKNDAIFLRQSLNKSIKKKNELFMPSAYGCVSGDFNMEVCEITERPKISFCGARSSHNTRPILFDILENCNDIVCKFNFTNTPCMGAVDKNIETKKNNFNENMKSCEFVFCPRGNGNFSIRFYEALLSGRIPIILNTDNLLPFEKYINWNEICVISENKDRLIKDILYFHKNNNLIEIQKKCKQIFKEYFIDKFDILMLDEIDKLFYEISTN